MLGVVVGYIVVICFFSLYMVNKINKNVYDIEMTENLPERKGSVYERYVKRIFDVICSFCAILCLGPILIGIAIVVRIKIGSPVFFVQKRSGIRGDRGSETIFELYKFRTMTNEKDTQGELLPDEARMTKFGTWLRQTSLDELPELFNILSGTMSIVGPRPQLVRDMTFMTKEQRLRHTAKPGLSGLAQINGRNLISWEDKINWDNKYIEGISFIKDIRIILLTFVKAFIKQEGISEENRATAEDFGDYLLRTGKITQEEYDTKQKQAKELLRKQVF